MNIYQYGNSEIAKAAGKTDGAVRVDIARKRFDPLDLRSTAIYIAYEILKGTDRNE